MIILPRRKILTPRRNQLGYIGFYAAGGMGSGGGGGGGDPYFANVSALLHFDGTDGSQSFVDVTGRSWSAVGAAQLSTGQAKFGPSSLALSIGRSISTAHDTALSASGVPFTIECFARFSTLRSSVIACKLPSTSATSEWMLYTNTSGQLALACWGAGNTLVVNLQDVSAMSAATWYHVSATRDSGGVWRLFRDGVIVGSTTESAAIATNTEGVTIGRRPSNPSNTYTDGYYDEFRITRGVARYTSAFAPPSAPFPNS